VGTTRSTQVEFTFPTREAAVAYAERQGLTFVIEGHDGAARVPDPRATNKPCVAQEHSSQRTLPANLSLARMQARRDPCNLSKTPDLKRALVNPAAVFRAPREIVDQPSFEHRLQSGTAHPLGLGRVSAAARERRGHAGRARVLASRRGQTRAPRPATSWSGAILLSSPGKPEARDAGRHKWGSHGADHSALLGEALFYFAVRLKIK
jgi:hypothetical protein